VVVQRGPGTAHIQDDPGAFGTANARPVTLYRQCRSRCLLSSPGVLARALQGPCLQGLGSIMAQGPDRHQAPALGLYQGVYASNLLKEHIQNLGQICGPPGSEGLPLEPTAWRT
jgi:hypothetical protein